MLLAHCRLNPSNTHQTPTIVIFCGPHLQGCYGVNCARHLANHNIKTIVFVPNTSHQVPMLSEEISLYELSGNKTMSNPGGTLQFMCI